MLGQLTARPVGVPKTLQILGKSYIGCSPMGSYGNTSKKGSEKVLERVLKGSQKGSEKGVCFFQKVPRTPP